MPRGSKPGERRGGRQRGTPNKKTALRDSALAAAATNPDISPLDYLLGIVRDSNESSERRFKAAQTTLPFVHAKPGSARPGDPAGPAKLIDGTGAFTIDNAVAKALRDDYHRLGELQRVPLEVNRRVGKGALCAPCPPSGSGRRVSRHRLHLRRCSRVAKLPLLQMS